MKEHPMLFSAPMVRALLDGTKTQTRRLKFRGAVGDRIWVKEAIARLDYDSSTYVADGEWTKADAWPWQRPMLPAMFCPKGLSRITLEVTALRSEPLQDISAEDSLAEGVPRVSECGCEVCRHSVQMCPADASEQVLAYAALWDSINSKRAPWETNPTVSVVTFKRLVP